jgi:hypothetical protein
MQRLRPQVEPTQFGSVDKASSCLQSGPQTAICFVYWAQLTRFNLKTETESSLWNIGPGKNYSLYINMQF